MRNVKVALVSHFETSESKIARLKYTLAFEKKMGGVLFPKPRAVKHVHLGFASFDWRHYAKVSFVLLSHKFRFRNLLLLFDFLRAGFLQKKSPLGDSMQTFLFKCHIFKSVYRWGR